jgi:hypothetical protein
MNQELIDITNFVELSEINYGSGVLFDKCINALLSIGVNKNYVMAFGNQVIHKKLINLDAGFFQERFLTFIYTRFDKRSMETKLFLWDTVYSPP